MATYAAAALTPQTISLALSLGCATYTDESSALRSALCAEAGLARGADSPEDAERALGLLVQSKPERLKELLREQGSLDLTSRLMVAELDGLSARMGVLEGKVEVVEGKVRRAWPTVCIVVGGLLLPLMVLAITPLDGEGGGYCSYCHCYCH